MVSESLSVTMVPLFNPTHLLVYGWNFAAHMRAMVFFSGRIPVLFRGDSTLLDEAGGVKRWLRRMVLRFVYRYVDKALYVGGANRQYYLAHGLKPHQLVYAPHTIDNERFSAWGPQQEQELRQLRKELHIAEGDRVILFVGKFEPKKEPALLLEAAVWGPAFAKATAEGESERECESGELDGEGFLERWNYGKVVEAVKSIAVDE